MLPPPVSVCEKDFVMYSNASVGLNVPEGLLVAASYSEVTIIRTCGYVLVVPPLLCGIAFGWMLLMRTGFFGRLLMKSVG